MLKSARAYDAATYCLRGPNPKFNFPGSLPDIPSASSLSHRQIQIQLVAARYARDELPSNSTSNFPSQHNNKASEEPECPSRLSLVSETALSSNTSQQISKERDIALGESQFDGNACVNLEKFPSIVEALGLDAIPTSQEQDEYLWNLWEA